MNDPADYPAETRAARELLDRHLAALNAGDADALAATLHFPHYRFTGHAMKTWESPANYLADFRARAGGDWHHSAWDFVVPVAAGPDKVHLDVQFTRYRADGSRIGAFRSL